MLNQVPRHEIPCLTWRHAIKKYEWMKVQLQAFLASALDGGE
jgi:hypothetical protein